jgi:hypothetical protein
MNFITNGEQKRTKEAGMLGDTLIAGTWSHTASKNGHYHDEM